MSASDGFLARWSRRKLETGVPAELTGNDELADTGITSPGDTSESNDGQLSPEEIAALPRVEDLTAETNLTQFLRAGVPALLRKEALRRMWSLDPAIRDFVGEARDYSYDWNTVGGVPASGPLLPTDDAEATLSRMFSRLEADADDEAERGEQPTTEMLASSADDAAGDVTGPDASARALADAADASSVDDEREAVLLDDPHDLVSIRLRTEASPAPAPVVNPAPQPRRHGTAIPKLD